MSSTTPANALQTLDGFINLWPHLTLDSLAEYLLISKADLEKIKDGERALTTSEEERLADLMKLMRPK